MQTTVSGTSTINQECLLTSSNLESLGWDRSEQVVVDHEDLQSLEVLEQTLGQRGDFVVSHCQRREMGQVKKSLQTRFRQVFF